MFGKNRFPRLSKRGQSFSEYAVILGLVAVVVVAGIYFYRTKVSSAYKGAGSRVAAIDSTAAGSQLPSDATEFQKIQNELRAFWASPRGKLILLGLAFLFLCLMFLNQYRAQRKLKRTQSLSGEGGEDGQAMTEFVLAFPVMLLTVLIIFQMSLLYIGHFMLNYAAYCAARTAVVWIPYDFTKSQQGGQSGGSAANKEKENELFINVQGKENIKIAKIRNAARLACTPISPPLSRLLYERGQEIGNAINNTGNLLNSLGSFKDMLSNAFTNMFSPQNIQDKAKDFFKEMFDPMKMLTGSASSPSAGGMGGGIGNLDFSSFLGSLGDSLKNASPFGSIGSPFAMVDSLLGDASTVMGGLEAPPPGFPEVPVLVKFLDKYAVAYIATSVRILESDGTSIETAKTFSANEDVIIEARHWFHLGIPIANGIIGKRVKWTSDKAESLQEVATGLHPTALPGKYILLTSKCVMPCEGRIKSSKTPGAWEWFW